VLNFLFLFPNQKLCFWIIFSNQEELKKQNEKLQEVPNFFRMEDFGMEDSDKTNEALISFSDLGLDEDLLKALDKMGIKEPSEIQVWLC